MSRRVKLKIKRIYERPSPGDGVRVLVDRLWPRGMSKQRSALSCWMKDVAPSDELRRRFHHHPGKWEEFRQRYFAELDRMPRVWQPILESTRAGPVTLLYAARDASRNNAVALRDYLSAKGLSEKHLAPPSRRCGHGRDACATRGKRIGSKRAAASPRTRRAGKGGR